MSLSPILIVGIDDDGPEGLPPRTLARVRGAEVLAGGRRHLALFPDGLFAAPPERLPILGALEPVLDAIARERGSGRRVVVLASGDPGFFGIARSLIDLLGRAAVEVVPHVSAMQLAFARAGEAWDDTVLLSAHARPVEDLIAPLRGAAKAGIFTDPERSPAAIARALIGAGIGGFRAVVCEGLGGAGERVREYPDLESLAGWEGSSLNTLVLIRKEGQMVRPETRVNEAAQAEQSVPLQEPPGGWTLGIPEEAFAHRKPKLGLITKTEVRVVSLAKLRLRPDSVVWDIGAGSGSVSIEAARMCPQGRVFAIEKNEEDIGLIRENIARFRTTNVEARHRKAPDGLDELPDPDAVFIGGSGSRMGDILEVAYRRLRAGGRLVANLATIENLAEANAFFRAMNLRPEVTLIQVGRSSPILDLTRFEALNPVYILTVEKSLHPPLSPEGRG